MTSLANPGPAIIPELADVSYEELLHDPYPAYQRIRALGPVVHVSAINMLIVAGFDDIVAVERDIQTFSSDIPGSNVVKLFGTNLMRKDGAAHRRERRAMDPPLRPGSAKNCWLPRFEAIVSEVLRDVEGHGEADLFAAVAEPISGRALAEMLGVPDVDWKTIARWSQAMMEGSSNYNNDDAVRTRALEAGREIEAAVNRSLDAVEGPPTGSLIASMAEAGLNRSEIHGNAKVAVGGGFNEPRDALLSLVYGLLSNPDQLARAVEAGDLWSQAFEEAVRWISPIGMYPRRLTQAAQVGSVLLSEGTVLGLSVAAANRDPARFENPDKYNMFRPKTPNLAFGSGPHFCAGTWVARALVAGVAAPALFARLQGLQLAESEAVPLRGWVFRGPTRLLVRWNK